jgi:hypothetical protein
MLQSVMLQPLLRRTQPVMDHLAGGATCVMPQQKTAAQATEQQCCLATSTHELHGADLNSSCVYPTHRASNPGQRLAKADTQVSDPNLLLAPHVEADVLNVSDGGGLRAGGG